MHNNKIMIFTRNRKQSFLILLFTAGSGLLSSLLVAPVRGQSQYYGGPTLERSTREEILANREKRKKQLEGMILDARRKLRDHNDGTKKVSEKEKESLEHKLDIYQRKLDTMQGDMDEREVERVLKREELRFERQEERSKEEFIRERARRRKERELQREL